MRKDDILQKTGIHPAVITPENMVAMKADLGIPWEKRKCMARQNLVNPLTVKNSLHANSRTVETVL